MDSNANFAIDLSLRNVSSSRQVITVPCTKNEQVPVVLRPIPRPPWTIMWYQSLWAHNLNKVNQQEVSHNFLPLPPCSITNCISSAQTDVKNCTKVYSDDTGVVDQSDGSTVDINRKDSEDNNVSAVENYKSFGDSQGSLAVVLDIACCDGPVTFERVSNPNFALTVEHNDQTSLIEEMNSMPQERHIPLKTYVCVYCNQSFKSLFCYQKHKKRHLNPVSVDITATHANYNKCNTENKTKTKDLNVQFFPCKKCGCKFPSYYFVHKHRKVCH